MCTTEKRCCFISLSKNSGFWEYVLFALTLALCFHKEKLISCLNIIYGYISDLFQLNLASVKKTGTTHDNCGKGATMFSLMLTLP